MRLPRTAYLGDSSTGQGEPHKIAGPALRPSQSKSATVAGYWTGLGRLPVPI
jgi:hypothetical protein